jgi:Rieske 2Fe-2S family protein
MVDLARIERLLDARRPGHALPQAFYVDPEVFEFDQVAIHRQAWILVGFEIELPRAGSYLAMRLAGAPVRS